MSTMVSLPDLAARINAEAALAEAAFRTSLDHARNVGQLLIQAKGQVTHGQWIPWLKENVKFSERSAQGYMRVAREWDQLQSKNETGCGFGVRGALAVLADTHPSDPPAADQTEVRAALSKLWEDVQKAGPEAVTWFRGTVERYCHMDGFYDRDLSEETRRRAAEADRRTADNGGQ